MIKQLLCDAVERQSTDNDVAVLLSGGVDSLSVAFSALHLNKNIHAYSFHLDTHLSYDFQKAKEVSELFGWKFTEVSIPTQYLVDDFLELSRLGCCKKTAYECTYPFLYVYQMIRETEVLSGWAADGYYGVSKKAMMHYRHTQEAFDRFRNEYFEPDKCANIVPHLAVAEKHSKKLITPYLDKSVSDFFMSQSWEDLNVPRQKHHVRSAFLEFDNIRVKNHLNLQLDSGISDLFETLLNEPTLNWNRRSRVMDLCRDYANPPLSLETFL